MSDGSGGPARDEAQSSPVRTGACPAPTTPHAPTRSPRRILADARRQLSAGTQPPRRITSARSEAYGVFRATHARTRARRVAPKRLAQLRSQITALTVQSLGRGPLDPFQDTSKGIGRPAQLTRTPCCGESGARRIPRGQGERRFGPSTNQPWGVDMVASKLGKPCRGADTPRTS